MAAAVAGRNLCGVYKRNIPHLSQVCGLKLWKPPPDYADVEFPAERKLIPLDKVPTYLPGVRPPKMMKDLATIRGPELVHNRLLYKQYGIITLCGGFIRPGHIDMIRITINKKLDTRSMFAVWRIDPPWKAITKKGQGKRMGKGKGPIDHYVTPVKAGRILIEVGGYIDFEEVRPLLQEVCYKLPVDAIPVSEATLQELQCIYDEEARKNINPFTIERAFDYGMHGCRKWIGKYDKKYYGHYI